MIGKVISFQVRDQEDEEQQEARLADQMDRQARVRFVVVVIDTGAMVGVFDDCKVISLQVCDQEDEAQRDVRLAKDRDHHALVRNLFASWSEFLLFGLVKSFSGARSRRC